MAYNKKKIESEMGKFFQQYRRKSNKSFDPNDRSYNRKLEKIMKRMKPEDLSKIINDDSMDVQ
ncbi:MAG: hypothetical protein AB9835_12785 [Eubacteriales bacterium]